MKRNLIKKIICIAVSMGISGSQSFHAFAASSSSAKNNFAASSSSANGNMKQKTSSYEACSKINPLPIAGVIALAGLGFTVPMNYCPEKTNITKNNIDAKNMPIRYKKIKDPKLIKRGIIEVLGESQESDVSNVTYLMNYAEKINDFIEISKETIKSFNEVKEITLPQLAELTGTEKRAGDSIVMIADLSTDYFRELSTVMSEITKNIYEMTTTSKKKKRIEAAENIIASIENIKKLKDRYLKLYTLNASYILQVEPTANNDTNENGEITANESGLYNVSTELCNIVNGLNETTVQDATLEDCINAIVDGMIYIDEINELLARIFKYTTTLSKHDYKKLAKRMDYINEEFFDGHLSLTQTEYGKTYTEYGTDENETGNNSNSAKGAFDIVADEFSKNSENQNNEEINKKNDSDNENLAFPADSPRYNY